ncbi:Selenocysteine insertion sequence-binding protein 2-like [Liparis tanakae]|uniref:Selenocysteine insertion sequence-binding protein 2-like n=1 Tax=Liparis tanakae TaxID=230148 RepID=A0A4Z2DZ84_9TELE|nr:Selenocysteine insertion sequence-binding protein 2-like [Liparis tanakae]
MQLVVPLTPGPLFSDFPGEASRRSGAEQPGPLLWKNKPKKRRASHPAESPSEPGAGEADVDSDSGYCSPKHNQGAGGAPRAADGTAQGVEAAVMTGTWVHVASQATPRSWGDRPDPFHRADQRRNPDQRNFSQVELSS